MLKQEIFIKLKKQKSANKGRTQNKTQDAKPVQEVVVYSQPTLR